MGCTSSSNSTKKSTSEPKIEIKASDIICSHEDIRQVYKFSQKPIGHRHYGTVRLAVLQNNPNKKFAVKTIPKETFQKDLKLVQRELAILK